MNIAMMNWYTTLQKLLLNEEMSDFNAFQVQQLRNQTDIL